MTPINIDDIIYLAKIAYQQTANAQEIEEQFDDDILDFMDGLDIEEKEDLFLKLSHLSSAFNTIKKLFQQTMAKELPENGGVRGHSLVFRRTSKPKFVVKEMGMLKEYLKRDWDEVFRADNSTLRRTALKAIAEKNGDNPDEVIEEYFDIEWSEPQLTISAISASPKHYADRAVGEMYNPHEEERNTDG
tara:strand:- start:1495 stop:2061 length:567 start_codon:yes stop_codon:yes gene_type:complete